MQAWHELMIGVVANPLGRIEVIYLAQIVKEEDEWDLQQIIEDIELTDIKLQYLAAGVDCEETNASPGNRARLKRMLLRAGACALEVALEILGKIDEREPVEGTDWP